MSTTAPDGTIVRSPFPIPFGWFQVAWGPDLKPGDISPLDYFDRKLVVWRDEDGGVHVNDAFCPHLGAHFAYGGSVHGTDLACPFHGWRFDGWRRGYSIGISNCKRELYDEWKQSHNFGYRWRF